MTQWTRENRHTWRSGPWLINRNVRHYVVWMVRSGRLDRRMGYAETLEAAQWLTVVIDAASMIEP